MMVGNLMLQVTAPEIRDDLPLFGPGGLGLDSVDADARYHAAVLWLHVRGDTAAALRLADTILAEHPKHLFGFLVRATAGRLAGDERLLRRATADFLAAWLFLS